MSKEELKKIYEKALGDPYAPAAREASFTVVGVYTVYIACDVRWGVVGDTIRIYGDVFIDTTGIVGREVIIQRRAPGEVAWVEVGRATTGTMGRWVWDWLLGYGDACIDWEWRAVDSLTGTASGIILVAAAHYTDLSLTSPASAAPGAIVTVSGILRYEDAPAVWVPIGGASIPIYLNGVLKGTAITGPDGSYSLDFTAPTTSGTYTIRAEYAGAEIPAAAALTVAVLGLQVGVPPQLVQYAPHALAAVPVLTVIGVIAYAELTKRR